MTHSKIMSLTKYITVICVIILSIISGGIYKGYKNKQQVSPKKLTPLKVKPEEPNVTATKQKKLTPLKVKPEEPSVPATKPKKLTPLKVERELLNFDLSDSTKISEPDLNYLNTLCQLYLKNNTPIKKRVGKKFYDGDRFFGRIKCSRDPIILACMIQPHLKEVYRQERFTLKKPKPKAPKPVKPKPVKPKPVKPKLKHIAQKLNELRAQDPFKADLREDPTHFVFNSIEGQALKSKRRAKLAAQKKKPVRPLTLAEAANGILRYDVSRPERISDKDKTDLYYLGQTYLEARTPGKYPHANVIYSGASMFGVKKATKYPIQLAKMIQAHLKEVRKNQPAKK